MSTLPRIFLGLALLAAAGNVHAETFVFAHLLEQSGSETQQPGTSESVLQFSLPSAQTCAPGSDVQLEVWWFDADGTSAQSGTGNDLCFPCSFVMGPGTPRVDLDLNAIIAAAGGYDGNGFDTYVVTGSTFFVPEPDDEVLVSLETKTWTDVMTLPSTTRMKIRPLQDRVQIGATCRTFIFDHLLETSETVGTASNYDTEIFAVYSDSSPTAPDVNLEIYLFDATTGEPFTDPSGGPICGPCSLTLGPDDGSGTRPKSGRRLDYLLTSDGLYGFPAPLVDVLAVVNATGGNLDEVSVSSMTTTSRSGPDDLSIEMTAAEEVAATAPTGIPTIVRQRLGLSSHPNPFTPRTTLTYTLVRQDDVVMRVVDIRGRLVRTLRREDVPAGNHRLIWDGRDETGHEMPSGIYFAELRTSDLRSTHKMTLVR